MVCHLLLDCCLLASLRTEPNHLHKSIRILFISCFPHAAVSCLQAASDFTNRSSSGKDTPADQHKALLSLTKHRLEEEDVGQWLARRHPALDMNVIKALVHGSNMTVDMLQNNVP